MQCEELEAHLASAQNSLEAARPELETLRSDAVRLRLDNTTAVTALELSQETVEALQRKLDVSTVSFS